MIERLKRLEELGWHEVTVREKKRMEVEDPDHPYIYAAFERADVIRYCYSKQEVIDFLDQQEKFTSSEDEESIPGSE